MLVLTQRDDEVITLHTSDGEVVIHKVPVKDQIGITAPLGIGIKRIKLRSYTAQKRTKVPVEHIGDQDKV